MVHDYVKLNILLDIPLCKAMLTTLDWGTCFIYTARAGADLGLTLCEGVGNSVNEASSDGQMSGRVDTSVPGHTVDGQMCEGVDNCVSGRVVGIARQGGGGYDADPAIHVTKPRWADKWEGWQQCTNTYC